MYQQSLRQKISTRFQVFFTEMEKKSSNVYKISKDETSDRNRWWNERVKPIFDKEKDNLVLKDDVLYYRKPLKLVPYIDYYKENHEQDIREEVFEENCVPNIDFDSYLSFLDFGTELQKIEFDEVSSLSSIPMEMENDVEDNNLLRDELDTLSSILPDTDTIDMEYENIDFLPVDELTAIDGDYYFAHYYEFLELISKNSQDFGEITSKLIQEMISLNITKDTESLYRQRLFKNPINIEKENLYQLREKLCL